MARYRRKKKISFFNKAMLVINLFVVVALLISYLAPVINPKTFWPIAFFGIAYFPLFLINCFFILYWLIGRPGFALLSFIAIIAGWNTLHKHVGFSAKVPEHAVNNPDSSMIRIMSFNVHFFRPFGQETNNMTIKNEILHLIDSISPDIVCMQEYFTRIKGENNVSETFTERIGLPYHFFLPVEGNDYEAYGLAIFSRYPIISSGQLAAHQYGVNGIIYADINKNGNSFRVYNVHLRSYGFQEEDYAFIKGRSQVLEQDVSSTRRIGSRLKHAFEARSAQAESLRTHSQATGAPYIIAGDFNDTPISYAVSQVSKGLQNAFRKKGRGWGETYNGDFPNFQIDYILASKEFSIAHYQIIKKKLSDHYPIWADLQL